MSTDKIVAFGSRKVARGPQEPKFKPLITLPESDAADTTIAAAGTGSESSLASSQVSHHAAPRFTEIIFEFNNVPAEKVLAKIEDEEDVDDDVVRAIVKVCETHGNAWVSRAKVGENISAYALCAEVEIPHAESLARSMRQVPQVVRVYEPSARLNATANTSSFMDKRADYSAFTGATTEKALINVRIAEQLDRLVLPAAVDALRIFDAGVGSGEILASTLEQVSLRFPKLPIRAVAKEISVTDLAQSIDRLPSFFESHHGGGVFIATNMPFRSATKLTLPGNEGNNKVVQIHLALEGTRVGHFRLQIEQVKPQLAEYWQIEEGANGSLRPKTPAVLVIHRKDQERELGHLIPRQGINDGHDFIIAAQAWRAATAAETKAKNVLTPLISSLRPNGQLIGFHSVPVAGDTSAHSLVRRFFEGESPLRNNDAAAIFAAAQKQLGSEAQQFKLTIDPKHLVYGLNPLLTDGRSLGVSRTEAAAHSAVYVEQLTDVVSAEQCYEQASEALKRGKGKLDFHDQVFVIQRSLG